MSKSRDRRGFGFSDPLPPTVYTPEQAKALNERNRLYVEARAIYEKTCGKARDEMLHRLAEIDKQTPIPEEVEK